MTEDSRGDRAPDARPNPNAPNPNAPNPDAPDPDAAEFAEFAAQFDAQLETLERDAIALRQRFDTARRDRQEREALQARAADLRAARKTAGSRRERDDLQAELKILEKQIDVLDDALESRLLAESSLKDVFWQAVRFGGLGVAIGWLLNRWAAG